MTNQLFSQNSTVLTLADVAQRTGREPDANLIANVNYYVRTGRLLALSKGLYATTAEFDFLQFANRLRRPSYISFYTVLRREGVVFQLYDSAYLAAGRSERVQKFGRNIYYRKLKPEILLNPLGVNFTSSCSIASLERALCDLIYLDGVEYFDNLTKVDWDFARRLAREVYRSRRLELDLNRLQNAR